MSETGTNYKTYKTIDEQIEYLKESKKIIVDDIMEVSNDSNSETESRD